ncbi:MAG: 50S ribosomal protein L9 [Alphaproteobacteria bacterium]|nr:50S ribosomal protein L9 [Alphaproteobacteria bacterium]
MEVILLERIERLGAMGQTVKVRPGYARNFLLPQNKALRATKANMDLFEKQRAELEARNAAERAKAETLAAKLHDVKFVVIRQASDTGHLFGSVSARDVAEAAVKAGHQIDRGQVQIDSPIKALGLFPVKVKLHPEVTIKVTVNVARSPEEAIVQAEKGAAVLKATEEKAQVEAAFEAAAEKADEPVAEEKPAKKAKKADAAEEGEEPKAKKPRAKKAAAE